MNNLKLLLIACFLLTMSIAQAQFGVKLGVNGSLVYGSTEDGETANLKTGYQGGVFYKMGLTESVGLMLELNYEARGTVSKKDYTIQLPVQDPTTGTVLGVGDYAVNQEANSVHNYLNVPILFVFGGENAFQFYAGPNIGFLLSTNADFDRTTDISLGGNPAGSIPLNLEDVDWLDYESFQQIFVTAPAEDGNFVNSFEIGINIGAMYNITDQLFVDLRVNQGILDTTNNHYDDSIYPDSTTFMFESREDSDRNLSVQLGLGYQF